MILLGGHYFYTIRLHPKKTIAILLYDNFTLLDVVGAYQTFGGLALKNYEIRFVAKQKGTVKTNHIQSLQADYSFSDIHQTDILFVPGGEDMEVILGDEETLTWIKEIDKRSVLTASVGSGSLLLGATGLLKNKQATTSWFTREALESYGAHYTSANYTHDGKYYTGSGASASIDMALEIIHQLEGEWLARATQLFIAYDPAPPVQSGTLDKADSSVIILAKKLVNHKTEIASANRKVIAMMLYDGFTMLDVTGPYQVFKELQPLGYDMKFVATDKGKIQSDFLLSLQAMYSMDELDSAEILFIPGGSRTMALTEDANTIAWVKKLDDGSQLTTSVCTGSLVLGEAGFLNGRKATSHWYTGSWLEDYGAMYSYERYTKDGKYITGAGVSSGIDMALMIVKEIASEEYAKAIQLKLSYFPAPPFNAGSPDKSDKETVDMLSKIYEGGIKRKQSNQKASNLKIRLWKNDIDPVCTMSVKNHAADTTYYTETIYGFCSHGCKALFDKNPDAYLTN